MQPTRRGPFSGLFAASQPADAETKHESPFGYQYIYVPADVECDGAAYAGVGLRYKGNSSYMLARDVKKPFIRECELYGATVNLVDGLITDAGRIAAEKGKPLGWYDVSTLKEPYRIEGKKTMAYELGEQLDWNFPDWIIYPTGGGTGMVGM